MAVKTTKGTERQVVTIQVTGKGSRMQAVFTGETCRLCGMPIVGCSGYPVTAGKAAEMVDRAVASSVAGCAFCAPDGVSAWFASDDALLRFTDAFGLTDRVLEIRRKLASLAPTKRWEPRTQAWAAIAAKYPKVPKASAPAGIDDGLTLDDILNS